MIRRCLSIAVLVLIGSACSTGEGDPTVTEPTAPPASPTADGGPSTIGVELGEWTILADDDEAAAGEVTFDVRNSGEDPHELVVVATDLAPADLPTGEDGSVDEGQVEIVDEVEALEPGDEGSMTVDLQAGSYVLLCNLVEVEEGVEEVHYRLGMRSPFTVS